MKAMVVYDSAYGNTERIAQAMAQALGSPEEVVLVRASQVQPEQLGPADQRLDWPRLQGGSTIMYTCIHTDFVVCWTKAI